MEKELRPGMTVRVKVGNHSELGTISKIKDGQALITTINNSQIVAQLDQVKESEEGL